MEKKILAVVNGRQITEDNLNAVAARFPRERRAQLATPEGQGHLLNEVIAWELMYDFGNDNNYKESEVYKFQLEEASKAILTQMVIQDTIKDINVTEDEMKEYYDENLEFFKQPEEINAKHILVDTEDKANEVLKVIENGMTFEEAANLYSNCPSKAQGGSLGPFSRGVMVPEFEEAAFTMNIGVVSKPVKTQFGFHLILVEEKNEAKTAAYEEVKSNIQAHMTQEKQNATYLNFVEDLKKKYNVEVK